jgi:hypothetical protein
MSSAGGFCGFHFPRVAVSSQLSSRFWLGLSRLKWPQAYPVVFPTVVFCLAGERAIFRG